MFGLTTVGNERTDETTYRLHWPETGTVRILLEVALVAHLVVIATPVLAEQVALLNPAIVPEPFTTGVNAALLLGVVVALVWLVRSRTIVDTHQFGNRQTLDRHLNQELPGRRWFLQYGGLAAGGGALAWLTYDPFMETFLIVVDMVVIVVDEFVWGITILDGLSVIGFLMGFLLFAIAIDRLVIGGLRWTIVGGLQWAIQRDMATQ